MTNVLVAIYIYLLLGAIVAAFTNGRSVIDLILDVILWPVIAWYWFAYGRIK